MFNYFDSSDYDPITAVNDLLMSRTLVIEDGMIKPNVLISFNSPWVFVHDPLDDRQCMLYSDICFVKYNFIHSRCHGCWKVCMSVNTVDELFQVHEMQAELGWSGKCGMDLREHTPNKYSAFWYTNSKEDGLDRLEGVRNALKERGIKLEPKLKRACTEFEHRFPDSSTWEIGEGQKDFENYIDSVFNYPPALTDQSEIVRTHIKRQWIIRAHSIGDMTYKKFTNGQDLFPNLVTYEAN